MDRLLSVRCSKGWRTYEWSAPFNPCSVGDSVLKLRPSVESIAAASGGRGGALQPLYLRLTVTMLGCRRYAVLRPMLDANNRLRLPYQITNRSQSLLAFCQKG